MRLRVCILALLLCACRPSDPKDPNTWLKRLSDSDPRARQQALQELRKLKAREAAPQVAQLLKDVMVREEAATALRDIGGADEVPALLDRRSARSATRAPVPPCCGWRAARTSTCASRRCRRWAR